MQKKSKIEKERILEGEKTAPEEKVESVGEKEKTKEKNLQDTLEEYADSIVRAVNYDRLKIWKEVFFHPTKTLTDEIKNKNLMRGAKDVFVASLIFLLLGFISLLLLFSYFGIIGLIYTLPMLKTGLPLVVGIGLIIIGILLIVLYFATPILSWLFVSALQYITAKLLGGKADFTTHAYLVALSVASATFATIPFVFLGFVPCVNIFAEAVRTLIILYGLYLQYKAIRIAHTVGAPQAIIALFMPLIATIAIVIILWLMVYFGLLSLAFLPFASQFSTIKP